ncbi:hypothetical protein OG196_25040 [Kitasatospora purpeofusca]|uniref:hypothetical protein n=1 Tax=Kitasatospora purpeofusca TaxID=67352 RepID=UPI002E0E217F|nr:hypothetical protein OG196_25040 [Kitasatospora purpeofusca]
MILQLRKTTRESLLSAKRAAARSQVSNSTESRRTWSSWKRSARRPVTRPLISRVSEVQVPEVGVAVLEVLDQAACGLQGGDVGQVEAGFVQTGQGHGDATEGDAVHGAPISGGAGPAPRGAGPTPFGWFMFGRVSNALAREQPEVALSR